MIGDLFDSPWKILIVAVVIIVLFGSAKLPQAARSLGRSMRILKSEVSNLHDNEDEAPASTQAAAPVQPELTTSSARPVMPEAQPIANAQQVSAQEQIDALQAQIQQLKEQQPARQPVDQQQS